MSDWRTSDGTSMNRATRSVCVPVFWNNADARAPRRRRHRRSRAAPTSYLAAVLAATCGAGSGRAAGIPPPPPPPCGPYPVETRHGPATTWEHWLYGAVVRNCCAGGSVIQSVRLTGSEC